ncbi:NADPH-dependent FMN reductase [Allorhizocola rhizosphaerae]|uniref:NADPH-dependent FMN reductase n=1 Tax=Allorhizocola rhizosphaerae TaxID=1872709 RepID=UPI000E3D0437|nr:NAD(P)H-dependent oxidoreductase [Allorhizocola rhizosphaerae]
MSTNGQRPRLNVVIASTRPGRVGEQVAQWFVPIAQEHAGFDVTLTDLAVLGLPLLDEPMPAIERLPYTHEHTRRWSTTVAASDAFVFVMAEYNQGYAASLKNALDFLYPEWAYKAVGFVSYGMSSGGLRAQAALRPVVTALKMVPVAHTVVMHLRETLDPQGKLTPAPRMADTAKEMLDELARMTGALAPLRA